VDLLGPVRALDARQQRSSGRVAVPFAVARKFLDDGAGDLAAVMAYYGFFSLFPLLLVFVTVLGFVLHGDQSLQTQVATSTLARLPVIGPELHTHALNGNAFALAVGLTSATWAGLGITRAAQRAFDRVWDVERHERPGFVQANLRGVATLAILGVLNVAASLASGIVSGGNKSPLAVLGGILSSLLLNFALFLAAFRLLTADDARTRALIPGAAFAAVAWLVLQLISGWFIGHKLQHASGTASVFGLVIALLAWLHLGAQATLAAAELNVVLERKLWPRSLLAPAGEKTDNA
jgi:YihY family inner membrane protein